jgi:hypothetical protein
MTSEPDLARLILDAKGDRSYERMSADCGGLPTDKRLQQMATTALKAFPDVATIRGLARGTGTTETTVVLAAARSLGLRVHSGEDPDALIIGGAGDLRPDQKDTIRALVRVFREMNAAARADALETAVRDGEQRIEYARELLERLPVDGPDRLRERALIVRSLTEAQEAVQAVTFRPAPAELDRRVAEFFANAGVVIGALLEMSTRHPPFEGRRELTAADLIHTLHAGSGKTGNFLRILGETPSPDTGPDEDRPMLLGPILGGDEPYPDPHDYDARAAHRAHPHDPIDPEHP